ncbi:phytanoyl-CoA dioxygenase family protein [Kitasatospora kifunensis]|uniref:Xylulose 5-phosphate/Fructose 6-phosphate phosphoketolase C-terminal domain-containing protein n=1 Tax=Kitasatospora kifunensis TaxID=58351 RepID=A0A7W7VZC1_KITKI|nr:phytanoyl-CoA dioxygenase family protein [Kitasatospora kifunensis]MBB4928632.1 hypothetical protein [Kitasatospora kifunensis]
MTEAPRDDVGALPAGAPVLRPGHPDLALASAGDIPARQLAEAACNLRRVRAATTIRYLRINDLTVLGSAGTWPAALTRPVFTDLFGADCPVLLAVPTFPGVVRGLLAGWGEAGRFHVVGYRDPGRPTSQQRCPARTRRHVGPGPVRPREPTRRGAQPMTRTPAVPPDPHDLAAFDRDSCLILRNVISPELRDKLAKASERLLASDRTAGRDRSTDGKDGFRGVVAMDDTFLPLVASPAVLPTIVGLLSPNLHLMSSNLIHMPSIPPDGTHTIRVAERHGWHRDMAAATRDLGREKTPRLSIKAAYYLSDITSDAGITMVLPGSGNDASPVTVSGGAIDPPGAITPPPGKLGGSSDRAGWAAVWLQVCTSVPLRSMSRAYGVGRRRPGEYTK